jgi:hypothetical protein
MTVNKRRRKKMQQVSCWLPDEIMVVLDSEVARTGCSRSKLMRGLLNVCTRPTEWLKEDRDR